ncbi:M23 family metallopeptidase [Stenotrophomonas sp. MMGLT7]|uniref:M23 family metallopeptidase n=1 Tax=Stenotrophomonas sp. MMGLT7 TaxID=2901227 RepID=UPI001E47CBDF|nr:M23 family metallopeptidase [Stenotrophomonas sp. MMGLT7]MCD7099400.1 M23 family metallopeptidase [Stenotrophomonas sp. MMGLT7]
MPAYNPGTGFRRGNRRFGRQVHPITKKVTGHAGDDWPAPEGTPIPAAYAGEVKEIRNQFNPASGTGWGWYVLLEHSVRGQVVKTRYAHMRQRSPLQVGDKVVKGQVIGEAGSTGGSTGPHLHFEVIVNNTPVDPSTFDFPDDDVRNDGNWAYPFQPLQYKGDEGQTQEIKNPLSVLYYESLANAESGAYPIGSNGIWHGGLHFDRATAVMLNQDVGVRCLTGGEVVAYRVDGKYPVSSYATGDAEYSTGFVLVRHKLQLPTAPRAEGGDNAAQGTGWQSQDASVK